MSWAGELAKALVPLAVELARNPKGFFGAGPERKRYLQPVPEESRAMGAVQEDRDRARREFERSFGGPL